MRPVTLREVLHPRNDIVHPRDHPSGDGMFVGLEHIEPHTGRRIGSVPIRLEHLTGRKARFFRGDIVYGYLRPYLNKVWVADFDGYCSVDQYVFTPKATADPHFLAAFMRSPSFLSLAPIDETPGQLPRIRLDEVLEVACPMPDVFAQQRIRDALGHQERALVPLRALALEQRGAAEAIRSRLLDSCRYGPEGRPWETRPFGDLLRSPLRTGISGPESPDGTMYGLSLAAVRDLRLDLSVLKRVVLPADTDRLVQEGAVYIVRGNGRLDLVGRCGVAPRPDRAIVFPDLLIEALPKLEALDPEYLALAWSSPGVRGKIEDSARTSAGIHKVNLEGISRIEVPVPPLAEQHRIAAELRVRLAIVRRITGAIDDQIAAIDALPASLLRRAFDEVAA